MTDYVVWLDPRGDEELPPGIGMHVEAIMINTDSEDEAARTAAESRLFGESATLIVTEPSGTAFDANVHVDISGGSPR